MFEKFKIFLSRMQKGLWIGMVVWLSLMGYYFVQGDDAGAIGGLVMLGCVCVFIGLGFLLNHNEIDVPPKE